MHPHALHALTALRDLAAALPLLRAQATAVRLEAADGLRSTIYGSRHSTGGHSDAVLDAILAAHTTHDHWTQVRQDVDHDIAQACWLVRSAAPHLPRAHPLNYLAAGIPAIDERTARDIAGWLTAASRRAHRALRLAPLRQELPGVDCPACATRMLQVACAGPDRDWTVLCGACRWIAPWAAALAGAELAVAA